MVKKNYNDIEVKNNMNIEVDDNEEVVESKEKKPLQKIVDVQPKKIKRSLFGRLITGITGPEGLPGIGTYVNEEIIKPAIKNIIFDAITSAASMAMYGDKRGPSRGGNTQRNGYRPSTDYSRQYSSRQQPEPRERLIARTPRHGIEEYVIADRIDASNVLITLTENADRYDVVSVADYYELIGVPSEYTDHNRGWTIDSITRATIMPVRGGYVLKFPPVEVI